MIADKMRLELALGIIALTFPHYASSQGFPNKPLHVIAAEAGGTGDIVARLLAQELTENLRQQVIVENRGAASGVIAAQTVASAPPDGYTLLLYSNTLWILPLLRENIPYDPLKDFSSIAMLAISPQVLVVNPQIPANSVRELIALAKSKPKQLNFTSGGSASSPHLAGELFKAMANIEIVHVPYRGSAPALSGLLGAEVQLMFPSAGSVLQHIKSGKLKALAATTAEPSVMLPGLATISASGLPGYESVTPFGIFAPSKTSDTLLNTLHQRINSILGRADIRERFLLAGVEAVMAPREQLFLTMKSDMGKWGKIIKEAGIKAD